MRKIFFFFFFIISALLFSQDWKDLFPNLNERDIKDINAGKYADRERVNYKEGLQLIPLGISFRDEIINDTIKYDPELCVEMVFILDRPKDVSNDNMMLYVLNNFRAFSEQAGIEYYSSNRKKMYPLIKESYYVDENRRKVGDPVLVNLPDSDMFRYYQKDTAFGSNYYTLKTSANEKTIWFQMENTTDLTVMGLYKALPAGGQRTNFIIYDTGENLVFYALAQIKNEPDVKKVLIWKVNIPGSFKRRMSTLVDWFKKRVE
ncbi:MAG: hypothetical protein JXR64_09595 [Spirochaetales bacterium]|nr:hypothetical protein [Spirochaetales bacterium]